MTMIVPVTTRPGTERPGTALLVALFTAIAAFGCPLAFAQTAPCDQTNWNTQAVDPVPQPCSTNDFQENTIFLQNMKIRGQRFFTAESASGVPSDIVAGKDLHTLRPGVPQLPSTCLQLQGTVELVREDATNSPVRPAWADRTATTTIVRALRAGNAMSHGQRGHIYKRGETDGQTNGPDFDWPKAANAEVVGMNCREIDNIEIIDAGEDYSVAPTVKFLDRWDIGGGGQATVTIGNDGKIASVSIDAQNKGCYRTEPKLEVVDNSDHPGKNGKLKVNLTDVNGTTTWTESGYDGSRVWKSKEGQSWHDIVRPTTPNGFLYRIVDKTHSAVSGTLLEFDAASPDTWPWMSGNSRGEDVVDKVDGQFPKSHWVIDYGYLIAKEWSSATIKINRTGTFYILRRPSSNYGGDKTKLYTCLVTGPKTINPAPVEPDWDTKTTHPVGDPNDQTLQWTLDPRYKAPSSTTYPWVSNHTYHLGEISGPSETDLASWVNKGAKTSDVDARNDLVEGGFWAWKFNSIDVISDAAEPTWPTEIGGQRTEGNGDLTWENVGRDAADVDFRATGKIYLENGFVARNGCRFHAYVKPKVESAPDFIEDFDYQNATYPNGADNPDFKALWQVRDGQNNIEVSNGLLHLKTSPTGGGAYVETFQSGTTPTPLFNHSYGRFDFVGRIATGHNTNNSYWLWCDYDGSGKLNKYLGNADEIDVEERADYYPDENKVCTGFTDHASYNYRPVTTTGITSDYAENYAGQDLGADFHTYSFEWLKNEQRFLIDNRVVSRVPRNHQFNFASHNLGGPAYIKLDNLINDTKEDVPITDDAVDVIKVWNFAPRSTSHKRVATSGYQPSIQSQLDSTKFYVYPNPSTRSAIELSIELPAPTVAAFCQIVVFDQLGKNVLDLFKGQIKGQLTCPVHLPNSVASGTYYCRCTLTTSAGTTVLTRRIVLER